MPDVPVRATPASRTGTTPRARPPPTRCAAPTRAACASARRRIIYKVAQACGINPQVLHRHAPEGAGPGHPHVAERLAVHDRDGSGMPRHRGVRHPLLRLLQPGLRRGMAAEALRQPARDQPVLHVVRARARRGTSATTRTRRAAAPGATSRTRRPRTCTTTRPTSRTPRRCARATARATDARPTATATSTSTSPTGSARRSAIRPRDRRRVRGTGRRGGLGAPVSGVLSSRRTAADTRARTPRIDLLDSSTGAKTVLAGPLRDYYFGRNGADGDMGWPALNQQSLPTRRVRSRQLFTGGSLYSSAEGTFIVRDPLRRATSRTTARSAGSAGRRRIRRARAGVCTQRSRAAAWCRRRAVRSRCSIRCGGVRCGRWRAGSWGVPVSALMSMPYHGGGFGQAFANGSAYYRAGGSAYFVSGAIRDHYFALGGAAARWAIRWRAAVRGRDVVSAGVPVRMDPVDISESVPGWVRPRSMRRTRRSAGPAACWARAPVGWSTTRSTAVASPRRS